MRAAWRMFRLAAITTALAASALAAAAAPVFPNGSGVGLDPPPAMTTASDFAGFQKGLASIVVSEFPKAAYPQIAGARAAFAAKFGAAAAEDVTVGGVNGFIVRGRQTANGLTFRKWAIVLDGPTLTALVSAQVPLDDDTVADASIEAALRSIVFRAQPSPAEQVAALPFTVGDLAGFRPESNSSVGGAVLGLTEGAKDVDPASDQPFVVISTSFNHPAPRTDRLAFARQALETSKAVRLAAVTSERLFEANGAQWAEIEATGSGGRPERPLGILFFLRFGDPDFMIVSCHAPLARMAAYRDRFRQTALSVRPKS